MNQWIEVVQRSESHGRSGGECGEDKIQLALKNYRSELNPYCRFIIGKKLMQEMRWVTGDNATVVVDPQRNRALLKRTLQGKGWQMSQAGKAKADKGHTKRAYLSIPLKTEEARVSLFKNGTTKYIPEFIEVTEAGIEFSTK